MKLSDFFYDYRNGVEEELAPESVSNIFGYISVAEVVYVMEQLRSKEKEYDNLEHRKSSAVLRKKLVEYEQKYSAIKNNLKNFALSLVGKPAEYVLSASETQVAQELVKALKDFDSIYEHLDVSKLRGLVSNTLTAYNLTTQDSFFRVERDFTVKALPLLGCEDVFGFTKALAVRAATENDAMYRIIYRNFVRKNTDLAHLTLKDFRESLTEVMKTVYLDEDTELLFYEKSNGKIILTKSKFEKRLHDKCVLINNKGAKDLYAFFKSYVNGDPEDPRFPVHRSEKIGRIDKSHAIYIFEIIRINDLVDLDFFTFHRVFQNVLDKLDKLEDKFKEVKSLKKDGNYKDRVNVFLSEYRDLNPFFKNMNYEMFEAFLEKAKAQGNSENLTLIDLNREAYKYTLYGAILEKKVNPKSEFNYEYFSTHVQGRFTLKLDPELFKKAVDSLIGKIMLDRVTGGTMSLREKALYTDTIVKALLDEYLKIKGPSAGPERSSSTQEAKVLAGRLPGYGSSSSSSSTASAEEKEHKHKHKKSSSHSERVKEETHKASKDHSKH